MREEALLLPSLNDLMKVAFYPLIFILLWSCSGSEEQTSSHFEHEREYLREIYMPCLQNEQDIDYQIKKLFTPDTNPDAFLDEILIDKIYINKLYCGDSEQSRVFFTRNVVNNSLLMNYLQAAPHISSFTVPNPHLFNIFVFELGGADSLHSFFFFYDSLIYENEGMACISTNREGSYFCDIFFNACGNRNCYPEWLNSGSDEMYSQFKHVKRYEDFEAAWQQFADKNKE